MARVIQDSDDEGDVDDELCSPARGNGTGSTESLRRKIEAAHEDLIAPAQSLSNTSANRGAPHISPFGGNTTLNSTVATDSVQSRVPMTQNSNAGEAQLPNPTSIGSPIVTFEPLTESILPVTNLFNGMWELPGLVQDDFEHHQPLAMFPDMSSTIPNSTLTQQKLFDEAARFKPPEVPAAMPLPNPDGQNSSIPWSAFITSPSEKKASTQRSTRTKRDTPDINRSNPDPFSQTPTTYTDQGKSGSDSNADEAASQDSVVSLVKDRKTSKHTPSKTAPSDEDNCSETKIRSGKRRASREIAPQQVKSDDYDDEVMAIGLPKERYQPRPSRSRSTNVVMQGPIDYSVRPERANKLRSKRRITTGSIGHLVLSNSEKAERICSMGFSPSNAKAALKACDNEVEDAIEWLLRLPDSSKSQSDTEDHTKLLQAPKIEAKEVGKANVTKVQSPPKVQGRELLYVEIPMSDSTRKRKTENPQKSTKQNQSKQDLADGDKSTTVQSSSEGKEPESIPEQMKKAEGPRDSTVEEPAPKRIKTTSLEQTGDIITSGLPTQPGKEKKKGRGRPRRSEKLAETSVPLYEEPKSVVEESVCDKLVCQVEDNYKKEEEHHPEANTRFTTTEIRRCSTPPDIAADITTASATATKAETTVQKPKKGTGDSLSPLGTSKVPLRVGLSKRARIAPLLRIMKK